MQVTVLVVKAAVDSVDGATAKMNSKLPRSLETVLFTAEALALQAFPPANRETL